MEIYFRVDCSPVIGTGHLMRCMALAEHFRDIGYHCVFVIRNRAGNRCDVLNAKGFDVIELRKLNTEKSSPFADQYSSWLGVAQDEDAEEFLANISNADLVVVDHYGIDWEWEAFVQRSAKVPILAIDDLLRRHSADVIIDQTFGREVCDYSKNSPNSIVLVGPMFALLKSNFGHFHNVAVKCHAQPCEHSLLISMGGIDNIGTTLSLVKQLLNRSDKLKATVLLNKLSFGYAQVVETCKLNNERLTHIEFSHNMASLMSKHTLAIGTPGSTTWERAALGIPSILIPVAENQVEICERMVRAGGAIKLEVSEIEKQINYQLNKLMLDYKRMRKTNLEICDGRGCLRVIERLAEIGYIKYASNTVM